MRVKWTGIEFEAVQNWEIEKSGNFEEKLWLCCIIT